MIDVKHYASDEVAARMNEVINLWKKLLEATELKGMVQRLQFRGGFLLLKLAIVLGSGFLKCQGTSANKPLLFHPPPGQGSSSVKPISSSSLTATWKTLNCGCTRWRGTWLQTITAKTSPMSRTFRRNMPCWRQMLLPIRCNISCLFILFPEVLPLS